MRNPNRIDELLQILGEYWHRNPDLRLGQIVVNLSCGRDPYHVEDDTLQDRLVKLLSELDKE